MIQFNLLPAVKIQYIKAQRTQRIVLVIATGASIAAAVLLFLSIGYSQARKIHMDNLSRDITQMRNELTGKPELDKILSVQAQLNKLPELYAGRPAIVRLPDYISKTTPLDVNLGSVKLNLESSTLEINGTAKSLQLINSYVDTLKFTTYRTDEEGSVPAKAFTSVAVSQVGKSDQGAGLSLLITFDPALFDASKNVILEVPSIVTTYEQVPTAEVFDGSGPKPASSGGTE